MPLGIAVPHILVLLVVLGSIALPFLVVNRALHARVLIIAIMVMSMISFVLFLLFGHAPARSDLVLLRCYAFSSALCSSIDELLSVRDGTKPIRLIVLVPFGVIFLFALICLIGGISGAF